MATVHLHSDGARRDPRSGSGPGGRHGRECLTEVLTISPPRAHRGGLITSLVTMARELVFPRAQATPVRSTPRRPSSPAPLARLTPPAPHDPACTRKPRGPRARAGRPRPLTRRRARTGQPPAGARRRRRGVLPAGARLGADPRG